MGPGSHCLGPCPPTVPAGWGTGLLREAPLLVTTIELVANADGWREGVRCLADRCGLQQTSALKPPIPSTAAVGRRTPRLDTREGGVGIRKFFESMASFRTALLATAATALSLAATPAALADGLSFTNKTTVNGLGDDFLRGVYASGSNIYAATANGLSISTNGGSSFTNYTTTNGLGDNFVTGVYASGSSIYAATRGGLSIA